MNIQINNYNELLEFIKRKNINSKQALEIVCKALTVVSIDEMTKDEIITATEFYINTYCQKPGERPIFLNEINIDVQ